jgi:cytochrome bd ubiquinol oxidase subunit I
MSSTALLAVAASTNSDQQSYLLQARQMQAMSFIVHIPLVCFGMVFPTLLLYCESLWLRTGDPLYRNLALRWTRVMIALFAVGVITGTILSFEMGLLWPNFTATFGSVFGLGFAIEGTSFFLEAIFIGIYAYGWTRLSPRAHFLSGIPIVITGVTGSFMVIAVNAWMNHPSGFTLTGGQVTSSHPWRALFANRYVWHEFVHMYLAAFMVTGFLVAACYAISWLRGSRSRHHRTALAIPLTAAAVAAPLQVLVGDWAARDIARTQPVKLAAVEGLGQTMSGAPVHLLGWYTDGRVEYGVELPHVLSLLASHDYNATVRGLNSFPAEDLPPVNLVRISFQTMVGIGSALALLAVVCLYMQLRHRRLPEAKLFYLAVAVAGPLSVIALIAGWTTTEVGRQPWVVYGVMRTSEAVTAAGIIPVSYAALALVYLGVLVALAWILRRFATTPLPDDDSPIQLPVTAPSSP